MQVRSHQKAVSSGNAWVYLRCSVVCALLQQRTQCHAWLHTNQQAAAQESDSLEQGRAQGKQHATRETNSPVGKPVSILLHELNQVDLCWLGHKGVAVKLWQAKAEGRTEAQ